MNIFVLREKHGDRYIQTGETPEAIEATAAAIVRMRLKEGYWYFDTEIDSANHYLEQKKASQWLRSRSNYEYEGVSLEITEVLE